MKSTEKAANAAVDLSLQITRELHETQDALSNANERIAMLRDDLSYAQRRQQETYRNGSKETLFDLFIGNPDSFMAGINYLRSEEGVKHRRANEKIALIKQVRILTFTGLREAKDLVEAFMVQHRDAWLHPTNLCTDPEFGHTHDMPQCTDPTCGGDHTTA